jgi:hypothetical protein
MASAFLDIAGVISIGVVGVLASSSQSSSDLPEPIVTILKSLDSSTRPNTAFVATVAALVAGLLLGKSLIYALLLRRIFGFLGNAQKRAAEALTCDILDRRRLAPIDAS